MSWNTLYIYICVCIYTHTHTHTHTHIYIYIYTLSLCVRSSENPVLALERFEFSCNFWKHWGIMWNYLQFKWLACSSYISEEACFWVLSPVILFCDAWLPIQSALKVRCLYTEIFFKTSYTANYDEILIYIKLKGLRLETRIKWQCALANLDPFSRYISEPLVKLHIEEASSGRIIHRFTFSAVCLPRIQFLWQ